MIFHRKNIFTRFPWINEKNHQFIVSSNYDGLICASLLTHFKHWKLVGYYDLESIWISNDAKKNKMPNDTIEGAELAFEIGKKIKTDFSKNEIPLMFSMINTICDDKPLLVDWKLFKENKSIND